MGRIIPAISDSEPCLNTEEACAFLGGITRPTLHKYMHGGLPFKKIGGRVWFLGSALREFVVDGGTPSLPGRKVKRTRKNSAEDIAEARRLGFKI